VDAFEKFFSLTVIEGKKFYFRLNEAFNVKSHETASKAGIERSIVQDSASALRDVSGLWKFFAFFAIQ
jgi:hypothetical protein